MNIGAQVKWRNMRGATQRKKYICWSEIQSIKFYYIVFEYAMKNTHKQINTCTLQQHCWDGWRGIHAIVCDTTSSVLSFCIVAILLFSVFIVEVLSIRSIHIHIVERFHWTDEQYIHKCIGSHIVVRSWCNIIYNLYRTDCMWMLQGANSNPSISQWFDGGGSCLSYMCSMVCDFALISTLYAWTRLIQIESMVSVYLAHACISMCNKCSRLQTKSFI